MVILPHVNENQQHKHVHQKQLQTTYSKYFLFHEDLKQHSLCNDAVVLLFYLNHKGLQHKATEITAYKI